jgi:hypothetical protein
MIERITDTTGLRSLFYSVFDSRSPFVAAGRPEFPVRAVLYPTWSYHLDERQFQAFKAALDAKGEDAFIYSTVEGEPEERVWTGAWEHWRCSDLTLDEYWHTGIPIESAHYSARGEWGILLSHEDHALLVCDHRFWDAFRRFYPTWRDDRTDFVALWREHERNGVDISWLQPFLDHLTN